MKIEGGKCSLGPRQHVAPLEEQHCWVCFHLRRETNDGGKSKKTPPWGRLSPTSFSFPLGSPGRALTPEQFNYCCICISPVVDPVACKKGHLFCRECIIQQLILLTRQKKRQMSLYLHQQVVFISLFFFSFHSLLSGKAGELREREEAEAI